MIDIELIRADPDLIRRELSKRTDDIDLDRVLEADRHRRELVRQVDAARADRRQAAREIGRLRATGQPTAELEIASSARGEELVRLEAQLVDADGRLQDELLGLPNLPDERMPPGGKESNQVVRTWGERPELGESTPDHVELCKRLDLVDYDRGVKLGGKGFWLYTGMGAALEWALLDFFCREHMADGYRFLLPPHLLTEESGYAAGQFPKFYDDVFHIDSGDDKRGSFLIPTAETAILNIYRDEVIPLGKLPVKAFAYTPSYRREAGSHGTQERGTIRGHQFNKVELFQFVVPEDAESALRELLRKSELLVEKLGLHYQTSLLAARDASATMRLTHDVEVWLPSIGGYKEVSSVSWAGDYQARRARIRFRREQGKRTEFVHTLNASGLATSRLLPAIVEQCQQPDGSVTVPEPLRPWLGTDVIKPL